MTIFKGTQKFFILRNQIRDADKNYVHTRMYPVTLQRTKKHIEQFTYTEERISYGPFTL